MNADIDVIFFDVGNVLLDMGGEERRSIWTQRLRISEETLSSAVKEAVGLRDKHALPEVIARLAERLAINPADASRLLEEFSAHWSRNEALLEFVDGLRGSYRVAIISNIPPSGRFAFETVLRLDEIFEVMFLSGELGIEKPDHRIYEIACKEMHVAPVRALFVDDRVESVESATAVGMVAHQHRTNGDTIRWLRSQLNLDEFSNRS